MSPALPRENARHYSLPGARNLILFRFLDEVDIAPFLRESPQWSNSDDPSAWQPLQPSWPLAFSRRPRLSLRPSRKTSFQSSISAASGRPGRAGDSWILPFLFNSRQRFMQPPAPGHLWKTVNNGITFEPLFENEEVFSIGDVAVAPSDPNIVWLGSGEANNSRSTYWGDGVYKSTDAGKNLDQHGTRGIPSHRPYRDPSVQSRYRVRGSPRAPVFHESGTGSV